MRLIEACSCSVYGGKMLKRQRPAAWRRGIWMMRGDINTPLADDPASWSECRPAQQRACRGGDTPSPRPDGGVGAVALCRLKGRDKVRSSNPAWFSACWMRRSTSKNRSGRTRDPHAPRSVKNLVEQFLALPGIGYAPTASHAKEDISHCLPHREGTCRFTGSNRSWMRDVVPHPTDRQTENPAVPGGFCFRTR